CQRDADGMKELSALGSCFLPQELDNFLESLKTQYGFSDNLADEFHKNFPRDGIFQHKLCALVANYKCSTVVKYHVGKLGQACLPLAFNDDEENLIYPFLRPPDLILSEVQIPLQSVHNLLPKIFELLVVRKVEDVLCVEPIKFLRVKHRRTLGNSL